ncbi:hypothetical protein EGR_11324 [Echinococcus granulosus]|uniref:Uncharacterized protein n=1 Tax=Echinococcus granulosus TaxID=6210 RepID=W6U040_ECHGR|nr:hypothetical protein EGR_11324 [Echinococcus granulosus]EUB53826.1 hypothetical protein EGR_11324 [Echinococcus granulosus]
MEEDKVKPTYFFYLFDSLFLLFLSLSLSHLKRRAIFPTDEFNGIKRYAACDERQGSHIVWFGPNNPCTSRLKAQHISAAPAQSATHAPTLRREVTASLALSHIHGGYPPNETSGGQTHISGEIDDWLVLIFHNLMLFAAI